jgi:hypothetical protein
MPDARRRETAARVALIAFLAAALFVVGSTLKLAAGWALPLPCVAALRLQIGQLSDGVRRAAGRLLAILLLPLLVVGLLQTAYPVLPELFTRGILRGLTLALAALAVAVAFGVRVLPHGRVILPTGVGLLLGAALCLSGETASPVLVQLLPWPGVALLAYLILEGEPLVARGRDGLMTRRIVRLLVSVATAGVALLLIAI